MQLKAILILQFFFLICFIPVKAQEVVIERSEKTEVIDGQNYYIHSVSKGQTLYSISKVYNVSVDELFTINPETKNGLSINQLIKIPVKKPVDTQTDLSSDVTSSPSDSNTIKHIVKSSETLFSIARNYKITTADILKTNQGLSERILPGQTILIPVSKDDIIIRNDISEENFFIHTVKNKETLYSIAKSYLVSIEEIIEMNPGLNEKIKKGQSIRIPVKEKKAIPEIIYVPATDTLKLIKQRFSDSYCNSPVLSDIYEIAFIMPLYLDRAYEVKIPETENEPRNFKSLSFIEFYEGAMLAVDTMKNQGMNLKFYVYDDVNDSTTTSQLLKKPEFQDVDLFIGPFFRRSFNLVQNFAVTKNINIVNPLSPKQIIIKNNQNVFKVVSSNTTQYSKLAEYLSQVYPKANIIIVNNNNNKNSIGESKNFRDKMTNLYVKAGRTDSAVKLVQYFNTGFKSVTDNLKTDCDNIVITLATGEIFYTSYIRNLRNYADNFNITLFSPSNIIKYESLELEYLQDLNINIFSSNFVDYSKQEVKAFVNSFRNAYHTEPEYYAYAGYDITLYFLNALQKYGRDFHNCVNTVNYKGLQTKFSFKILNDESGFENNSLSIYKMVDYKWVEVE